MRYYQLTLIPLALFSSYASAIPAFPGAEGFGANATGGRSGSVYVVSSLADSGSGTLRDAVSAPNRIVVFSVGGTINIKSRIVCSKNITILGQTAPGDGIATYGNGWSFSNADNTIVRYIRIRMGKIGTSGKDAAGIAEGENMIFDHVSVSWGRDETFSINGEEAKNITIQNSIISQGLETHSCGGLMQTSGGVSLFRNLYIDNKTRNPKVKGVVDFVNNIVYNWGAGGGYIAGGDSEGTSTVNIIGNYFISGPNTSASAVSRSNDKFSAYVADNWYDADKNGQLDGKVITPTRESYGNMTLVATRYSHPQPATTLAGSAVVDAVLGSVGASKVRDEVDAFVVDEVRSWGKKGDLISDPTAAPLSYSPANLKGGPAMLDSDGDGIPDEVEVRLGLDPNVKDSMLDKNGNEYADIEDWANSLVA